MTQKSRLGKGLGALFPPLPGESAKSMARGERDQKQDDADERTSSPSHVGAKSSVNSVERDISPNRYEDSDGEVRIMHEAKDDVSRETTSSSLTNTRKAVTHAKDSHEIRGSRRGRSTLSNKGDRHRSSIPTLLELAHPSDVFFGATSAMDSPSFEDGDSNDGGIPAKTISGAAEAMPGVRVDEMAVDASSSVGGRTVAQVAGADTMGSMSGEDDRPSTPATSGVLTQDSATKKSSTNDGTITSHGAIPNHSSNSSDDLPTVQGGYLADLKISDVVPNAHQPRSIFDEDELNELADSIRQVGVLQPIVVRKYPVRNVHAGGSGATADIATKSSQVDGSRTSQEGRAEGDALQSAITAANGNDVGSEVTQPGSKITSGEIDAGGVRYELIMGERRWRASQLAGLDTIPAIVKTTQDDDMLRDALLENLHRVNLNPLEEAAAYQQMIKEFGLTQAALSKAVSKSRPQIANMLRLLNLPGNVQKRVAAGVLSAGHARALLGLNSPEDMDALAKRIIAEGLSVRSTEEIVALKTQSPATAKIATEKRPNLWEESPVRRHLEDHFETKVAIRGTEKHGKIEIVFSSPEDMRRIVDLLIPNQNQADADPRSHSDGWV